MARLLVGGSWYEAVNSRSWNESDYERLILDQAGLLFPRWVAVPFKVDVTDASAVAKRPDLALVDPLFRAWWVVEVELQHHSLEAHVLPQVRVFREGRYAQRHADFLAQQRPEWDLRRCEALMQGDPPGVLVVVDSHSTGWREPLKDAGVRLAIVEPFRDQHGRIILRLNGDQPQSPTRVLTRCSRMPNLRRLWKVHSPAALPDGPLRADYGGELVDWDHVRILNGSQLRAQRGDPLSEWASFDLLVRDDGSLAIEPVRKLRGV